MEIRFSSLSWGEAQFIQLPRLFFLCSFRFLPSHTHSMPIALHSVQLQLIEFRDIADEKLTQIRPNLLVCQLSSLFSLASPPDFAFIHEFLTDTKFSWKFFLPRTRMQVCEQKMTIRGDT